MSIAYDSDEDNIDDLYEDCPIYFEALIWADAVDFEGNPPDKPWSDEHLYRRRYDNIDRFLFHIGKDGTMMSFFAGILYNDGVYGLLEVNPCFSGFGCMSLSRLTLHDTWDDLMLSGLSSDKYRKEAETQYNEKVQ